MSIVYAFVFGGLICVVGEFLISKTGLTPARILVGYVIAGVFLSSIGLYEPFAKLASEGAYVPLTGFGNLMALGVKKVVDEQGVLGIFLGGLTAGAAGITVSVLLGILCALFAKPHTK